MLPITLEAIIGRENLKTWHALVESLPAARLFHGTSQKRAEIIEAEEFRASFGQVVEDHKIATYWGHAGVAESFAIKKAYLDNSFPVIISARLEDIIASGDPRALRTSCDDCDIEYPDWLSCYDDTGMLWIQGGRHVSNIEIHRM